MSCQTCGQQGVCYVLEHVGTEPIYINGQQYGQGDFCFSSPELTIEYQGVQYQIDMSYAPTVQNIYGCCPSGTTAKLTTVTTIQGQNTPIFVPYAVLVSQGTTSTSSTTPSVLSKVPWWLIILLVILGAILLGGGNP
ncbi:hypothetical protein b136 [Metallosphaera turreted icosahedral virus]|uniref:hypothetical protein b136 n=1 Tax=Metallosphaera turreted icosahedral virus TaxID=2023155 RepID=UPI000B8D5BA1|nr:hypothetical protein b136 [Metallosphaera turreted icosahedral virus]ASO67398.1 hypothetical protein b136 [Metallosphaera turreted icosahedral virus]ASO67419.1 hypothetical protein b136 [Metallosphaera turreted icosahedral virus]